MTDDILKEIMTLPELEIPHTHTPLFSAYYQTQHALNALSYICDIQWLIFQLHAMIYQMIKTVNGICSHILTKIFRSWLKITIIFATDILN